MKGNVGDLQNCCGFAEVGGWGGAWTENLSERTLENYTEEQTGFAVTTFIDNKHNKEAYDWFAKRYKLVYQTPLRAGLHGNGVFMAVWDIHPNKPEVTK